MPAGQIRDWIRNLGLLFFATILMSAGAQDAPTEETELLERFEVELLVFAYRDVFASGEQLRPPPEPLAELDSLDAWDSLDSLEQVHEITPPAIERLSMEVPPVIQVQQLINAQLLMEDEQQRLDRVDAYDLLLHTGFSQEGVEEKWAIPVSVRRLGAPAKLDGTIRLHRGRFLHITLDLSLDANVELLELSEPYRLEQQRRLRSGEVHYFDHPAFGVVLTVRPEPEPEPEPIDPAAETVVGQTN
ncbi:MAG: CsiV family protein [Gammaproteobacteria bacterium]